MIVVEVERFHNPQYRVFHMPEKVSESPHFEVFIRPKFGEKAKCWDPTSYLDEEHFENEHAAKLRRIGDKGAKIVSAIAAGEPVVDEIFVGPDWIGIVLVHGVSWKDAAASVKAALTRTLLGTVSFQPRLVLRSSTAM